MKYFREWLKEEWEMFGAIVPISYVLISALTLLFAGWVHSGSVLSHLQKEFVQGPNQSFFMAVYDTPSALMMLGYALYAPVATFFAFFLGRVVWDLFPSELGSSKKTIFFNLVFTWGVMTACMAPLSFNILKFKKAWTPAMLTFSVMVVLAVMAAVATLTLTAFAATYVIRRFKKYNFCRTLA